MRHRHVNLRSLQVTLKIEVMGLVLPKGIVYPYLVLGRAGQSFGEYLRCEREARGIELHDVYVSTRIPVWILDAIERNEFHRLPSRFFRNSFVRQYASAVGLDQDEIANAFAEAYPEVDADTYQPQPPSTIFDAKSAQTLARVTEGLTEYLRRNSALLSVGLGILVLTLILLTVLDSSIESHQQAGTPPPFKNTHQVELKNRTQQESHGPPTKFSVSPSKQVLPVHVEIRATDTVWVRATRDGRRAWEHTLRAGQRKFISAGNSIRLIVGNAGGIELTLNGQLIPPIGERGQVRRVVFTPAGMNIAQPPPRRRRRTVTSDDLAGRKQLLSVMADPVLARSGP